MSFTIKIYLFTFFTCLAFSVFGQGDALLPANKQKDVDDMITKAAKDEQDNKYSSSASLYSKVAIIYWKNKAPNKAIDTYLKAAKLNEKAGNNKDLKTIYSNVAVIYTELEKLNDALFFFKESLKVRRLINNQEDLASGLIDMAYVQIALKQHDKALEALKEALSISTNLNNAKLILSCYNLMNLCYNKMGNVKMSNEYNEKFKEFTKYLEEKKNQEQLKQKDVEKNQEIADIITVQRAKELEYQLNLAKRKAREDSLKYMQDTLYIKGEKQKLEIDNLAKTNELANSKIKEQEANQERQRIMLYSLSIGLALFLAVLILIVYNLIQRRKALKQLRLQNTEIIAQRNDIEIKNTELNKAFQKIDRQNQEITSSISYASRIQVTILPDPDYIKKHLPDSFILFQPRDVVSGDYYWFNVLESDPVYVNYDNSKLQKSKKIAISAIDCTGHGVPGALLSVIANNLLHQIVMKDRIHKPSLVLEKMNRGVRKILRQDVTKSREGMDMSFCIIDEQNGIVEYSGAKSPIIYLQNGVIEFIKGDLEGVGGLQVEEVKKFENFEIQIPEITTFYIFSDGYHDQFGGTKGKKMMTSKFKDILAEIYLEPITDQREILIQKLNEWRGPHEQTDDILVIGFKVVKTDNKMEIENLNTNVSKNTN